MKNINVYILIIAVIVVAMCFFKSMKTKEKFAEEPTLFERLTTFLFGQQKPVENVDAVVESNSA